MRSLVNKIADLHAFVQVHDPDVIGLCETWLSQDVDDFSLGLPNYEIFRRDRGSRGGGLLFAIKTKLSPCSKYICDHHEILSVNITNNNITHTLLLAYRPPSTNPQENMSFIGVLNEKIVDNRNVYIFGDFNYPHINWENSTSRFPMENEFLDFCSSNALSQFVIEPTRGDNILDLFLTFDNNEPLETKVINNFSTSDHASIEVLLSNQLNWSPTPKVIKDFSNANWELIHGHLSCINWDDFFPDNNVHNMWAQLKSLLLYLSDLYIPSKIVNPRKSAPWFSNHLKSLSRKKKSLYKKCKRTGASRHVINYRNFCQFYKREIQQTKVRYERNKFLDRTRSKRAFFSYLDSKTKNRANIPNLQSDTGILKSDQDKANAFMNQFSSVYTPDNNQVPSFPQVLPENSLNNINITEQDVFLAMSSLAGKKSCGPDQIYTHFLYNTRAHLTRPFYLLFMASLITAQIPDDWKEAHVVPVYKRNKRPAIPSSYRPISLTSVTCKLLESIVLKKLINYFNAEGITFNCQHGFMSGRSTLTNLLETLNDITNLVNDFNSVDIVYLDVRKAFDSVSHQKIIYKLRKYGIGGSLLAWIQNFLSNRVQRVKVGNAYSSPCTPSSGLAQGSILGPWLFLVILEGLPSVLQSSKIKMYADDAKIYGPVNNLNEKNQLQSDISLANDFLNSWQLFLNPEKCELIHIGNSNHRYQYCVNDSPITDTDICRDLGVITSSQLNSHAYCSQIVKSTAWRIKQLNLVFHYNDVNFRKFLYVTYIRPLLEYNTQIWSPHLVGDINLIENVQRRFTKFLPGLQNLSYIQRLTALNLETLEVRRIIFDLILMFKIVRGLVDINPNDFFQFNESSTRGHCYKIRVQFSRINSRKYFYTNRVVPIWNSLDSDTVCSNTVLTFKKKVRLFDLTQFCRGSIYSAAH